MIMRSKQFRNVKSYYEADSMDGLERMASELCKVHPKYEYIIIEVVKVINPKRLGKAQVVDG